MTAQKYYKRGVVTAEQFDGSGEMAKKYGAELYSESGYGYDAVEGEPDEDGYVLVTPEGYQLVRTGDWIMTGANDEHWPVADDIFRKTYQPLPVIPQAAGKWIKDAKESRYDLIDAMAKWTLDQPVFDWIHDNSDTFALAWLMDDWEEEETE